MNDSSAIPPLWQHQIDAIQKSKKFNHFALFHEMGTGKSRTLINILEDKYKKEKGVIKTLILCPLVVCENWKKEFAKYSAIPEEGICVLSGPGTEKAEQLKATSAQVVVTNYDALLSAKLFETIFHWGHKAIVLDESHRIKDHTTQRSKKCILLGKHVDYKFILSGTPYTGTVRDMYSQFLFLDDGETFGNNFYKFQYTYFKDYNARMPRHIYFPNWKEHQDAKERVGKLIAAKSSHAAKSECLDLPPLVEQKIYVPLGKEQERLYKQMEKEFITYYQDSAVVATIALTKILRMMQIVSGFVKSEDGTESTLRDVPRLAALSELLEDTAAHSKIIVWAVFKKNYEQISDVCNRLKLPYLELHGATTNKGAVVDAFNGDSSVRVLIAHPGSGGIGVNLTSASHSIWYSRNYSFEQDEQAAARNYRGGSEIHQKITRIDLIAKDSIDEVILECVKQKIAGAEEILSRVRKSI